MRRARGFTLIEIMVALALTSVLVTSVLVLVRTQLMTYELDDQLVRTQQNTRAAMDFVEGLVRRACGGVSQGGIGVNVGTVQKATQCLNWYDGATVNATSFTTGASPTTSTDALEVVYASGAFTAATAVTNLLTTTPSVTVADVSNFSVNDYVLVADTSFQNAYLFKISAVTTTATAPPKPGTLSFGSLASAPVQPTNGVTVAVGSPVMKAQTWSIFMAPSTATAFVNMLMLDPNGVASSNHLDFTSSSSPLVQPVVDGVVDFQVAVGIDGLNSGTVEGTLTEKGAGANDDEWVGNVAGETLPALPWNQTSATAWFRQVRLSVLLQTMNVYTGTPPTLTAMEDRAASSYPTVSAGSARYRSDRIIVAPRSWNLGE
jgi:prepilin-type N-terminal cleavage/methylation domain-containing protein